MNPLAAITDMTSHSTIYKRHMARNNQHNSAAGQQPIHHPENLLAVDHSLGETLNNLSRRSTIYRHHDQHHLDMNHDQHAGEKHMHAHMIHQEDGVLDTFKHLMTESSIFERNMRRNEFLH